MHTKVSVNHTSLMIIEYDRNPDECPNCHRAIDPVYLSGYINRQINSVWLTFYCPKLECSMPFIGVYEAHHGGFRYDCTLLGTPKMKDFSDSIKAISQDFISIYNQSQLAEANNLGQICGVGYRKALEFLVKDYIIYTNKTLRPVVEKLQLGPCINTYLDNDKLKGIAKRATWIGNDETHYVRKWADKDVTDLKLLIDLTVHWIETEILTNEAIKSMPEK